MDELDNLLQAHENAAMGVMADGLNHGLDSARYREARERMVATHKAVYDFVRNLYEGRGN